MELIQEQIELHEQEHELETEEVKKLPPLQQLFQENGKWCKGALARSARGYITEYTAVDADKFCLLGACGVCYGSDYSGKRVTVKRIQTTLDQLGFHLSIPNFNDSPKTSIADIRALVELADV